MHFRHNEMGYIIMAIYSKLPLNVPMSLEVHVSQSVIYTSLKGSRMHSYIYRFLGEFDNNPIHPYSNLGYNLDISKKIREHCQMRLF